jgi:hypothetical protein
MVVPAGNTAIANTDFTIGPWVPGPVLIPVIIPLPVFGGVLSGDGDFRNNGDLFFSGGRIENLNSLVNADFMVISRFVVPGFFCEAPVIDSSLVRNDNRLVWAFGDFYMSNEANPVRKAWLVNNSMFELQSNGGVGLSGQVVGPQIRNEANGTMIKSAGGAATIQVSMRNVGTLDLAGGRLDFLGPFLQEAGEIRLNQGVLAGAIEVFGGTLSGGGDIVGSLDVAGTAWFSVSNSHVAITGDYAQHAGTTTISGGFLDITGRYTLKLGAEFFLGTGSGNLRATNGFVIESGGLASGAGTITANVTNAGRLSVGNRPFSPEIFTGTLQIFGDYQQTGVLDIDLRTPAVGDYDRLQISGTATLSGALRVSELSGFAPAAGHRYDGIVTYNARAGDFDSVILPAIAPLLWNVERGDQSYNLVVAQ